MEVSEIQEEFYAACDGENQWENLRALLIKLEQENPDSLFEALFGIFINKSRPYSIYTDQYAAGGLLWILKPKYTGNLREDIIRSFENWDISIETLPWYFAEVAGKQRVCDELKSIIKESLDDHHKIFAEGYLYFIDRDQEYNRRRLNYYWDRELRE
jgi:hypothetical protein